MVDFMFSISIVEKCRKHKVQQGCLFFFFVRNLIKLFDMSLTAGIITSALGGLINLGSTIGGSIASKKVNDQAQAAHDAKVKETDDWWARKENEDILARSEMQNILRKQREMYNEQMQRARATNLVAGGTDESLALQQQSANKAVGDTMAEMASHASAIKDANEAQYLQRKDALYNAQQQIYANKANAISQAASQAAGMGTQAVGAGLNAITKAKV